VICSSLGAIIGAAGGAVTGTVGGAIAGGANALPAETANEITAALGIALGDRDLAAELAGRVLARTAADGLAVVNLGAAEVPELTPVPAYSRFDGTGVNTVLELHIAQVALTREERGDAPFSLAINAGARLIRISDGQVLWSDPSLLMLSPPEQLGVWLAPGGDLLRTEIDAGVERLALRICAEIFQGCSS
jgi:hypothetical protein